MRISYTYEVRFDTHELDHEDILKIEQAARRKRTEVMREAFRRGLELWKAEYPETFGETAPQQGVNSV